MSERIFLDVRNAMYGEDVSSRGFLDKMQYIACISKADNTKENVPHITYNDKDLLLLSADFNMLITYEKVETNTYAFCIELVPTCDHEVIAPDILTCINVTSFNGWQYWSSGSGKNFSEGYYDCPITINVNRMERIEGTNKYIIGTYNIGREWSWFTSGTTLYYTIDMPMKLVEQVSNTNNHVTLTCMEAA